MKEKYSMPMCAQKDCKQSRSNAVALPVHPLEHRMPSYETKFDHAQKKTLSLGILIRAQWVRQNVVIAAQ
jgi:hypothetical protein